MRIHQALLGAAMITAAGCSVTDNYDRTQNPFLEPSVRIEMPEKEVTSKPTLPSPSKYSTIPIPGTATIRPAPAPPALVSSEVPSLTNTFDQMIAEANRLGAAGDVQGKAQLLEQAGYTGSGKAFYLLARMQQDGSLPKSDDQMLKFLALAHEAGEVEATRVLGLLYLRGLSVPKDIAYGRGLLDQAAATSSRAALEYGQLLSGQSMPDLKDINASIPYLRFAYQSGERGAFDALLYALEIAGASEQALILRAQGESDVQLPSTIEERDSGSVTTNALTADDVFNHGQAVLIRRVPDPEPEFTGYCWIAAADALGHPGASKELDFIQGVRAISDRRSPGRLDACIQKIAAQYSRH
ncbi:hypothetical protein LCGC14_0170100 [marine sediment metagenome]|jgi:hypothetical protein|uniref:Sel1 repeat family protein n=1 Tax=marine sediment metagenome TaxID=412755 RepID=A0A0F9XAL4_9ZZZZ